MPCLTTLGASTTPPSQVFASLFSTSTAARRRNRAKGEGRSVQAAWSFHLTTTPDSAVQADLDVVALSTYRACVKYY